MSRGMIIGLVAAGVVIVGGGAAYLLSQDEDSATNSETSQNSTGDASQANTFNPNWSDTQPFVATLTTDGEQTGQISSNGQGVIQFTTERDGETSRFIYSDDAYYACTGDSCIKYPLSQATASAFNPEEYQYDEDRISNLRGLSSYKGQQPCGPNTCDVWEYATEGTTSTLYLDPSTKRIVMVKHVTANGQTSEITYDYKEVTIAIPQNAREINIPGAAQ